MERKEVNGNMKRSHGHHPYDGGAFCIVNIIYNNVISISFL